MHIGAIKQQQAEIKKVQPQCDETAEVTIRPIDGEVYGKYGVPFWLINLSSSTQVQYQQNPPSKSYPPRLKLVWSLKQIGVKEANASGDSYTLQPRSQLGVPSGPLGPYFCCFVCHTKLSLFICYHQWQLVFN